MPRRRPGPNSIGGQFAAQGRSPAAHAAVRPDPPPTLGERDARALAEADPAPTSDALRDDLPWAPPPTKSRRIARRAYGRKYDREERKDRYFQLHHYMLKTDAWKALSAPARAVYIQIGSRYNGNNNGNNNGKLACSVRDAAKECNLAKNTASRAF
jgi:hypothetical protein